MGKEDEDDVGRGGAVVVDRIAARGEATKSG
jgi:hypothetical protein